MTNYFDLAAKLSRARALDAAEPVLEGIAEAEAEAEWENPRLAAEEHWWIEKMVGRELTNEEAQEELRRATITAAAESWLGKRDA